IAGRGRTRNLPARLISASTGIATRAPIRTTRSTARRPAAGWPTAGTRRRCRSAATSRTASTASRATPSAVPWPCMGPAVQLVCGMAAPIPASTTATSSAASATRVVSPEVAGPGVGGTSGRAGPAGPLAGDGPCAIPLGPPATRGDLVPVCDPTARPAGRPRRPSPARMAARRRAGWHPALTSGVPGRQGIILADDDSPDPDPEGYGALPPQHFSQRTGRRRRKVTAPPALRPDGPGGPPWRPTPGPVIEVG